MRIINTQSIINHSTTIQDLVSVMQDAQMGNVDMVIVVVVVDIEVGGESEIYASKF